MIKSDRKRADEVLHHLYEEFGWGGTVPLGPEFFLQRVEGDDDYEPVWEALALWVKVRQESPYGQRRPLNTGNFRVEADHSFRGGLLSYILAGNEPHPVPPPRYYSRPAHWLIDAGPDGVKDKLAISKLPWTEGRVGVGHDIWELVEERGEGDYILKYDDSGLWRATLLEPPENENEWDLGLWHLRPWTED